MGVDAEIYFKTKSDKWNGYQTVIGEVSANQSSHVVPEATHTVDTAVRYYGINYERGPWELISAVLMELLADEEIEKVWYGDDHSWPDISEINKEEFLEITKHYLEFQNRPYFDRRQT